MKIWITKHALSYGIMETDAEIIDNYSAHVKGSSCPTYCYGEGEEWHRTKESAIARAEKMRQRKIEMLKRQIEELEEMKFE